MVNWTLLFLLFACVSVAQTPETEVLTVLKNLERAEQIGDGKAWIALWDRATNERLAGRDMPIRPRPDVRYKATKTLVQGGEAAMAVEGIDKHYASMRLVIENGEWKIAEQIFSNVPPDPRSLYALVPPPDGAFARAGAAWQNVPRSSPPNLGWLLQAIRDQSYL